MKHRRWAVVPLALGMLATAACSNGEDTGEMNITPLPVANINAREPQDLTQGGELRLPVDRIGESLNPLSADASPDLDQIRRAILPTLFQTTATGEVNPDPNYLQDFEVTSQPGEATTVTLHLNPNAVWGNGDPVTADDVVATWRACSGQVPENNCRPDTGMEQIRDVVAVSPTEAAVSFSEATPDWTEPFARVGILRASSVSEPSDFNQGWEELRPEWSSGPFEIENYDTDNNVITLTPNDDWWGPPAHLARLTIVERDEAEHGSAYTANDVDVLDAGTSAQLFAAGTEGTSSVLRRGGGTELRSLVFNTESASAVSDPLVRQAITKTLDRSKLGTQALPDIDFTAAAADNRIFRYGQEGYQDNATEVERNLRQARKALDEAGWEAGGDGTRTKDGQPLEVSIVRVLGNQTSENEAREITAQLAQVGITVVNQDVDQNTFADGELLRGGTFQMATISHDQTAWPLADLGERFATGGDRNYSRTSVPEIDAALEQLSTETDPVRRREIANQVDVLQWQHLGTVPLYQVPESIFTRSRLANYGAMSVGTVDWARVGYSQPQ